MRGDSGINHSFNFCIEIGDQKMGEPAWYMMEGPSCASSIISTTTRFSTSTLDDPFADTQSIDIVAGGQHFHINRNGSQVCQAAPPPYTPFGPTNSTSMAASPSTVAPTLNVGPGADEISAATVTLGHPQEQLAVEEPLDTDEDNIDYPTGPKLWLSISSLVMSRIFVGLDMTIVAVAVPALTDYFKTIDDIGWYSSAYMVFFCSFIFLSSQLYSVFSVKKLYLLSVCIFQLGSLICTVAPKSGVFILGRAVAGFGSSIMGIGGILIVSYSFPKDKRPLWTGVLGAINSIAMVSAPLVGGALIDALSWRACFGINLPFGALTIGLTLYGFTEPIHNPDTELPLKDKLRKMDLISTFIFIPSIVCLLIALQWGGTRYGWKNAVIIVMFVLFAAFLGAFIYLQYRAKDAAALPSRVLKQRTVLAGAWFAACCNGILAVTEYFISIYFQGVRGYSATKAGALGVPLIVGLLIAVIASGVLTSVIGYYYPFMICTSIFAPIAAGLLTTLDLDGSLVKVLSLLGFLGTAVGLGLSGPINGVQNVLPNKDLAVGIAITGFAGSLGSALFICTSSALFQNRLVEEIAQHAPGVNMTAFEHGGLTDIRKYIGGDRLRDILLGYDEAVSQTLYIPVALAVLTLLGSMTVERRSVKKKKS